MVDLRQATAEFALHSVRGFTLATCGNFDPVQVMYRGTAQEVYRAVTTGLAAGGPKCFSAAGCEIPDGTPLENLRAQTQALKDFAQSQTGMEDQP